MENKVFQRLETYNIHQETFTHPAIFTVQQSEELAVSHPGAHTKNLFLKPKKADYFILVCIAAHKRLSLNSFGKTYGIKDITFGTPEELKEILGVTPGSVGLFGLIHYAMQKEKKQMPSLQVMIDRDLRNAEHIGRHPNINTATTVISHEGCVQFLNSVGLEALVIDCN